MVIDRVSLKESAEQNYFGRERMQPGRDGFGVLAKNPRAAAKPESRSLPTTIFACGQISAQRRVSDCRSSSVPQPARKMPADVISFGNSLKIARNSPGVARRRFAGGNFP